MASKVIHLKEENGLLSFTITSTDVSYVNAIRRTILADIPVVVFKTTPYEENKANIQINTSRLPNEIIKQRLSCIPICISEPNSFNLNNYVLEIDVENNTDTTMIVTTRDFNIRNLETGELLPHTEVKKIFPPFVSPTGIDYYIDFLRLRPKISDEIPGERIKLTCAFTIGTARDDSMFNVTGTCSYGCTPDQDEMEKQLGIKKQEWKDEGYTQEEVKFKAENWKLLEGLRYVVRNSFDFVIESVGIYDNEQIIMKACDILKAKLEALANSTKEDTLEIKPSETTMENCYDVILENEDYTIGNMLNYELYQLYYVDFKKLDYVGFKKMHPHDTHSVLRLALSESGKGQTTVKNMIVGVVSEALKKIASIKACFSKRNL